MCWIAWGELLRCISRLSNLSGGVKTFQTSVLSNSKQQPSVSTYSSLEPQEAAPKAQTLLEGTRFITRRLRHPFYGNADEVRGIFFCSPGVSGLRSCVWTHLKRPCARLFQLVGRTTNNSTYSSLVTEKV